MFLSVQSKPICTTQHVGGWRIGGLMSGFKMGMNSFGAVLVD